MVIMGMVSVLFLRLLEAVAGEMSLSLPKTSSDRDLAPIHG